MKNNDSKYFSQKYVDSRRVLYTPSAFARESLIHVQEIGELQAIKQHISRREGMESYLFIEVVSGEGSLTYHGTEYKLRAGDCVFIDCKTLYSHETSDSLWCLRWVHFYGENMPKIYEKYVDRGGRPAFRPESISGFDRVWAKLFEIASSSDYIRDMRINEGLNELLTLIMEESWCLDERSSANKRKDLAQIVDYLREHYSQKITLDELADRFFINKFYLTRIFKEQFGLSINQYLLQYRITKAKQALRFSDDSVENIGYACGLGAPYYFSRVFKKVEGIPPGEFRKRWQG
ncbi:MAG: helix-turn-helix domain-containing protein [Ruminococcaceae bacterium]|nr:helix-turn-helix domain-containing protein [Oscillospiraceae bacterium]